MRRAGDGPSFRPDIDGLRAVAILAVVLFHAGVPGLSGGFVGVDVFFVISGFLITRKLLADAEHEPGVRLGSFWAKRVRRLVPGLVLMVVVTLALALVAESPMRWMTTATEGLWASLYVSNVVYAREAADYFGGGVAESPFLHTWSLAVEEQFYVLWPLLFVGAAALVRRRRTLVRPLLVGGFAVLAAGSFALALVLTASEQPVLRALSFYGLPTRAWEFAVAGLLAAAPVPRVLRRRGAQIAMYVGGALLLAWAITQFRGGQPYPGWRTLVPVAATVLLITAGAEPSATIAQRALRSAPAQWLGRLSYSWYLWHWPLMVLAVSAFDVDTVWFRTAVIAASLPVALLAYRLVEQRLRFLPLLTASNRATFVAGAAATALAVVAAAGVYVAGDAATERSPYRELLAAADDDGTPCTEVRHAPTGEVLCVAGDADADTTVFLVGDSHADHWQTALGAAAEASGVRLVVRSLSNCPGIPIRSAISVENPDQTNVLCEQYQADTDRLIDELRPGAVVLSHAMTRDRLLDEDGNLAGDGEHARIWGDAVTARVERLRTRGVGVGAIDLSPQFESEVLGCLADHGLAGECDPERSDALSDEFGLRAAQSDALERLGVATYSPAEVICDRSRCHAVIGGDLVFRDVSGHLTNTFTSTQVQQLEALLDAVVTKPSAG